MRWIPALIALAFAAACKQASSPNTENSTPAAKPPAASADPSNAAEGGGQAPAAAVASSSLGTTSAPTLGLWNFDADVPGAPPPGFELGRTGSGRLGQWRVVAAADAPSRPNVLVQLDADETDYRFPVAVVERSSFKDVRLSVSCKPVAGQVDQGCGLVWRFKDPDNYYLTRANALEDNVNLYYVKGGRRISFASYRGKVTSNVWHKLRVDARADRFEVYFDEKKVLDAKDSRFDQPGKVGLWTKADSVIQFDDLSASAL
jgi:hypothetical protein